MTPGLLALAAAANWLCKSVACLLLRIHCRNPSWFLVKEKGVVVSLMLGVLVGGFFKVVGFTIVFKIWVGLGFIFPAGDLGTTFTVVFTLFVAVLPRAADLRVCVGMALHTNESVVLGAFLRNRA